MMPCINSHRNLWIFCKLFDISSVPWSGLALDGCRIDNSQIKDTDNSELLQYPIPSIPLNIMASPIQLVAYFAKYHWMLREPYVDTELLSCLASTELQLATPIELKPLNGGRKKKSMVIFIKMQFTCSWKCQMTMQWLTKGGFPNSMFIKDRNAQQLQNRLSYKVRQMINLVGILWPCGLINCLQHCLFIYHIQRKQLEHK